MVEIIINGQIFKANTYDCHPTKAGTSNQLQTIDGADHVSNVKIKEKIMAGFVDISDIETARLLQAVYSSPYLTVTFLNSRKNVTETKVFRLTNDPSIPVKIWKSYLKYYEGTSIELLEKGATRI